MRDSRFRRLITIPGYWLAGCLWFMAAPIWLPVAAAVDLLRGRGAIVLRCAAVVSIYFSCELVGMGASGLLWVWKKALGLDEERWVDLHFRLEAWWGSTIFRAVVLCFGLHLDVEGEDQVGEGPYLLFVRHSSFADTLLASALASRATGIRLRYVLKQELLWDPCLDIVGNRIPNVFVDRSSPDSEREIRRVQELAVDLGQRDGILIYPEGTRFSASKRTRVLESLREKGDKEFYEYAESLSFVLPPRLGGPLGLLEAAPDADVVVCAHTGFEGSASLKEIWEGALMNRHVRVEFRRIARDAIPNGRDERRAWLFEEWNRVDAWIAHHQLPESRIR